MTARESIRIAAPAELIAGRYRVDAKLGEGGMGVVYRVWDQFSARPLALKWLTPTADQRPVAIALFEREFHTLKNLAHPNIVEVYDYGIAESPYYTMELLAGTSANQLAPMPWRRVCSVLRDVASALALIHSRRLVHRDVTTRNIQCAADGSVKLLDFGSLAPMGVSKDCVGTAPYMAPEALHRIALDQRTDLYSLGATAYYLLTGRHRYPARDVSQLQEVWGKRLPQVELGEGIPAELDTLVMSLLDLNPLARPVSASVVIARLTAIAGLPAQPSERAARSFLITPQLVGREHELIEFRAKLARALAGQGSTSVLEAQPGMGRSRLLDAYAALAQVAGALVLRADARDGSSETDTLAALHTSLRGYLDEASIPDRGELPMLAALRRIMRAKSVVILIDDLQGYSPASLRFLARLLRMTERDRLLVVLSHSLPLSQPVAEAVQLLLKAADRHQLSAFDLSQTTELLASCFDSAPNLKAIAAWSHMVSAGRPGVCVALAQHLVDTAIAVYEAGAWTLPESLAGHGLPETVEQLLQERLRRLDQDQRLWGQLLSLIPSAVSVSAAECVDLMRPYTSRARSYAAITGLMTEQFVSSEYAVLRLHQSSVREAFLASLTPESARSLHRLLAEFFERRGDEMSLCAAAHHLQQAGDREQAIRVTNLCVQRMIGERSEEELAQAVLPFGEWGDTFESALEFAERQGWPRHEIYPLYTAIMTVAALSSPRWLARGEPLFQHLKQDTGFVYWSEAELAALEAGQKVSRWKLACRLLRATLRHLFAPRRSRGLNPFAALKLLGIYVTTALGVCNITQRFHTGVPPLARALLPFRSLSPVLDLLYELLAGSADAGRGLERGWKRLESVMQRLQDRVKGMPDVYRITAICILRHNHAVECLAPVGDPRALEVAQWLDDMGGFDAHAQQLRRLYYLYMGDGNSAERCRQELETLALTNVRDNLSVVAGSKDVAQAQALCGDALALRATLQAIETTAERFPDWRGQLLLCRGEYARLVGDLGQAQVAFEQALAFAPAGENYSWARAVPPYVDVLVRLGRVDDAVAFAERALADCARLAISSVYRRQIEIAVAVAWAAQGQHARAARHLDQMLATAGQEQLRGVALAVLEEARARVALLCGDAGGFERASQGVARVFANHDDPTLLARYRRLMDDALQRGLLGRRRSDSDLSHALSLEQSVAELRERIDHTASDVRLQRALELLLEHCEATAGHLFVVLGTNVQCVASAGEVVSDFKLDEFVRTAGAFDRDVTTGTTVVDAGSDEDVTRLSRWTSHTGLAYDLVPLHRSHGADGAASSVAALRPKRQMLRRPAPDFLCALVRALIDTGDLSSTASIHTTLN